MAGIDQEARTSERGSSLVEALVALLLIGFSAGAIAGGFTIMMDANTRSAHRNAGMVAAEQTIEALRLGDPELMPNSGSSAPQRIRINDRDYDVVTSYCTVPAYCQDTSRHISVEVFEGGTSVYTVETVFTQFN